MEPERNKKENHFNFTLTRFDILIKHCPPSLSAVAFTSDDINKESLTKERKGDLHPWLWTCAAGILSSIQIRHWLYEG